MKSTGSAGVLQEPVRICALDAPSVVIMPSETLLFPGALEFGFIVKHSGPGQELPLFSANRRKPF